MRQEILEAGSLVHKEKPGRVWDAELTLELNRSWEGNVRRVLRSFVADARAARRKGLRERADVFMAAARRVKGLL